MGGLDAPNEVSYTYLVYTLVWHTGGSIMLPCMEWKLISIDSCLFFLSPHVCFLSLALSLSLALFDFYFHFAVVSSCVRACARTYVRTCRVIAVVP